MRQCGATLWFSENKTKRPIEHKLIESFILFLNARLNCRTNSPTMTTTAHTQLLNIYLYIHCDIAGIAPATIICRVFSILYLIGCILHLICMCRMCRLYRMCVR